MNITLGYAREVLAQFADSGYCADDSRVADCINSAVQKLMIKSPADATTVRMRFYVTNGTITLPREVSRLLKMNACARSRAIHNRWYEFLEGGPGSLDFNETGTLEFVDMGDGYRTHTDMITPRNILVSCDSVESATARILIRGSDENGQEVITDGALGEQVEFDSVNPRYTASKFSTITSIVKPVTNGYVYLSSYDPDNPTTSVFQIAVYHPYEELPAYRRYFVTGGQTTSTSIIALGKLRFVPAIADSDTLLVQSIPALQAMMQSQNFYNAADFEIGEKFEIMAVRYYTEQIESENMGSTHIDFVEGFAPGDITGVN